jgi:hypothetical protein
VNGWLQDYYRLCGRTAFDLPNNEPRNVFLRPDEVLRLTPENRISRITIVRGTIWLTASPANGDVLLSAGENFSLEGNWPFVVQALGEATGHPRSRQRIIAASVPPVRAVGLWLSSSPGTS